MAAEKQLAREENRILDHIPRQAQNSFHQPDQESSQTFNQTS